MEDKIWFEDNLCGFAGRYQPIHSLIAARSQSNRSQSTGRSQPNRSQIAVNNNI